MEKVDTKKIVVTYDREADVLYVAIGQPEPAVGEVINGVIYRYSNATKAPCGATVLGYRDEGWSNRLSDLADEIANHLPVLSGDLVKVIKGKRLQFHR